MVSILDNALNGTFGPLFQSGSILDDAVQVKIQGKIFSGWSSVAISKAIDSMSPSFTLNVADKWRQAGEKYPIMPGNLIGLGIGTDSVLTGFIDQLQASVSNEDRNIVISGRSKTGDLIDSAAIGLNSTYKNITLADLATVYAQDFDIKVKDISANASVKIPKVVVNQGETIFELLSRYAGERNVVLTSDSEGNLLITNRAAPNAALALPGPPPLSQLLKKQIGVSPGLFQGKNVLFAESTFDETDRFQKYLVKSQITGTDEFVKANVPAATGFDDGVKRQRTKYVMAEKSMDVGQLKKRASWEANMGAANAAVASVTVQGWRDQSGNLWDVNTLVDTDLTFIGFVKGYYLIRSVTFVQEKPRGTLAVLGLSRADSFLDKEPDVNKDPKGSGKKGSGNEAAGWDPKIFGEDLIDLAKSFLGK